LFGALLIGLGLGIYVKIHGLTMSRNVTSAVSVRGADRFRYPAASATPRATYAAQLATPPFNPD
jgi:hypothetical protein